MKKLAVIILLLASFAIQAQEKKLIK